MKSIFGILFSVSLISTTGFASLSGDEIAALRVVASRKALTRLDFDSSSKTWSLIDINFLDKVLPFRAKKNRFDLIQPLEDLVQNVGIGYSESVRANKEFYHLIRRAYSSLSSLYSHYKLNPYADLAKHSDFIGRFAQVLIQLKGIVSDIENTIPTARLFKTLPPFGNENDRDATFKYLDMGTGLTELNATLKRIGNTETRIDRAIEFHPITQPQLPGNHFASTSPKKMAVFLIHGTFSAHSKEYSSDDSLLLQQAKHAAQTLANEREAPVEFYSFGWNGHNNDESRMAAGEELANFVRTYFPPEEYQDVYIGHSHGGNVILHFARTLREYHTPFLIVTLGAPMRKDFMTDNLNYLVQFFSETDWVQHYGSYEVMTFRNATSTGNHTQNARMMTRDDIAKLGLFDNNNRYNTVKIYGVKVLFDYNDPKGALKSHFDLKHVLGPLPRIIDTLFSYKPNNAFVLNTKPLSSPDMTAKDSFSLGFQLMPIAVVR